MNKTGAWRLASGGVAASSARCSEDRRCRSSGDCGATASEAFGERCVKWMGSHGASGDRGSFAGRCDTWASSRSCVFENLYFDRVTREFYFVGGDEAPCAVSLAWDSYNLFSVKRAARLPFYDGSSPMVELAPTALITARFHPCFAHWVQDELFPLYWLTAEDAGTWDHDEDQYVHWFTDKVGGGFHELNSHVSCRGEYAHGSLKYGSTRAVSSFPWVAHDAPVGLGDLGRPEARWIKLRRAVVGGGGGRSPWDASHYAKGKGARAPQKVDGRYETRDFSRAYGAFVEKLRQAIGGPHLFPAPRVALARRRPLHEGHVVFLNRVRGEGRVLSSRRMV